MKSVSYQSWHAQESRLLFDFGEAVGATAEPLGETVKTGAELTNESLNAAQTPDMLNGAATKVMEFGTQQNQNFCGTLNTRIGSMGDMIRNVQNLPGVDTIIGTLGKAGGEKIPGMIDGCFDPNAKGGTNTLGDLARGPGIGENLLPNPEQIASDAASTGGPNVTGGMANALPQHSSSFLEVLPQFFGQVMQKGVNFVEPVAKFVENMFEGIVMMKK